MLNHEHNMEHLIKYALDNGTEPYASAIYDQNNKLLAITMGDKNSPINHAELMVINKCAELYPNIDWSKLTLYTTAEPNCMCAAACCWANLNTVIYSVGNPFILKLWGLESELRAKDIIATHPKQPQLIEHVCKQQGEKLFMEYKELFAQTWNEKRWKLDLSKHDELEKTA